MYCGFKVSSPSASLSPSLFLPASRSLSALPDSTINPPTHTFAHTHTHIYAHQSIQACLALPKPKMTIDFLSTLPLNYANLWFMFRYFFGIPTPDMGWGFPLRQGWKDTGVGNRRGICSGPDTLFLTSVLVQNSCKMCTVIDFEINMY